MALALKNTPNGTRSTSVTIPSHAVGDLIVIFSISGTVPSAGGTVPTWTTAVAAASNLPIVVYAVATATNHTSGTWTGSGGLIAAVFSGQAASPIGGTATSVTASSGTSPMTAPSITLADSSGASQILHFYSGLATSMAGSWSAAPGGYTSRVSANPVSFGGGYGYRMLTKDTTTSDGSASNSYTNSMEYQYRATVEILAAAGAGAFFAMF